MKLLDESPKTPSENASALYEGWSDLDPSFAAVQQLE